MVTDKGSKNACVTGSHAWPDPGTESVQNGDPAKQLPREKGLMTLNRIVDVT